MWFSGAGKCLCPLIFCVSWWRAPSTWQWRFSWRFSFHSPCHGKLAAQPQRALSVQDHQILRLEHSLPRLDFRCDERATIGGVADGNPGGAESGFRYGGCCSRRRLAPTSLALWTFCSKRKVRRTTRKRRKPRMERIRTQPWRRRLRRCGAGRKQWGGSSIQRRGCHSIGHTCGCGLQRGNRCILRENEHNSLSRTMLLAALSTVTSLTCCRAWGVRRGVGQGRIQTSKRNRTVLCSFQFWD